MPITRHFQTFNAVGIFYEIPPFTMQMISLSLVNQQEISLPNIFKSYTFETINLINIAEINNSSISTPNISFEISKILT